MADDLRTTRHRPAGKGGQDVLVVFGTRVGSVLLGLAIQAVLARLLLPEGRGAYAVCFVFATVLGMLTTPGAQQGAQQLVMTRETDVSQATSCAFVICVCGGVIGAVLGLASMGAGFAYFDRAEPRAFHWAIALAPLLAFALAVEHQLAALQRFGALALIAAVRMGIHLTAALALVGALDLGVDGALVALAGATAAMIGCCLWDLKRRAGLAWRLPRAVPMRRILGYGLRYHAARAGEALGPHMGVLLLGWFAGEAEIGLFAVACSLMIGFLIISNAVGNVLLPRIAVPNGASGDEARRIALVGLCLRLVGATTALAMIGTLALSGPIVRLLFSEAFLPAQPLLWIIAPGMFAGACAGMYMTYFKAVNKPEICSWAFVLGIGVDVAMLLALYPRLGVAGAAWAMSCGLIGRLALLAWLFRQLTGVGFAQAWAPRRGDGAAVLAAMRHLGGARRGAA